METWYSEAAIAIAEYLNGYNFPLDRNKSIQHQEWWPTLADASYNLISEHFKKKNIMIELNKFQLDWILRRAYSRGVSVNDMSHRDMVIYDIVDILPYYNMYTLENPPLGYIIPESFSL